MVSTTKRLNRDFFNRLTALVGSRWFFAALVVLFVVEAAWIALSGRYPMAFDENFHLGIIRLYAHHISPFWGGNPSGAGVYGPVARDPSYLYQWLMSFPYRLSSNIIFLRFINIGLFAAGLPLYRRLLLKTGASRALVHFCLALFVLVPIVPLLAAQINYDNLLLPLTAVILLLTVNFTGELSRSKRIDGKTLLILINLGLLASLVKYAFLPVLLAAAVYVALVLCRTYPNFKKFWHGLGSGLGLMTRRTRWLLIILLIVSMGLFIQRYGVNLARYHKPVPSCDEVLSVQECSAYAPWYRDYQYAQIKIPDTTTSPLVFGGDWFYGMWFRTFFAVDGPATDFATRGPFVLPGIGAIVFSLAALGMTLACLREVFNRYNRSVLWLFAGTIAFYEVALWLDEYRSFLQTGRPVAINGRYLLPILPLLMVLLALGANTFLGARNRLKLVLAAGALVCLLSGGGTLTYILRSNDAWYWPDSPLKGTNHAIQNTVGPLVPGNSDPRAFMGHHGT
ncbi:MAG TPA: hypothetical protein VFH99_00005 [Candidatus Saccharimonadales bacterium]|nr:hypothetical protein [Candidatus Saccharimonadales bacterium]